jgi:hypothetical protein
MVYLNPTKASIRQGKAGLGLLCLLSLLQGSPPKVGYLLFINPIPFQGAQQTNIFFKEVAPAACPGPVALRGPLLSSSVSKEPLLSSQPTN